MRLHRFTTGTALLARAGEFLETRELDREFVAGVAAAHSEPLDPPCGFFLATDAAGRPRAALVRTMPRVLGGTGIDEAAVRDLAGVVAAELLDGPAAPDRLFAPAAVAAAVAEAWGARGGTTAERMAVAGYRLATPREPAPGPGRCAPFGERHLELLLAWSEAFGHETGLADERPAPATVAGWISEGRVHGWWVDGEPVAATLLARETPRTCTLTFVWTPAEHRRRGHAARLVATLGRRIVDEGRTPVLFADRAYEPSNALYRGLGYEVVGCWRTLQLA